MSKRYQLGRIQKQILQCIDGKWARTKQIVQDVYQTEFLTQCMYSRIQKSLKGLEEKDLVEHEERIYYAKPSSRRGFRKQRPRKTHYYWRLKF